MRLERSHFLWKNAIQVEKLPVEEIDYKIDKKEIYYKCEPTTIYFKKVLAMTGTETFTVLSTEDLEQTSGGLAVWEDGYSRWLYYREFAPYMRQGALNSYIDAWKYGFRTG
ncbi:bacteriocin-type signal sequence [Streptococcus pneumoniae PNI0007]|nr:bacteriocin-type signal sequence [Streptococcus pneumoniae PNI0007]